MSYLSPLVSLGLTALTPALSKPVLEDTLTEVVSATQDYFVGHADTLVETFNFDFEPPVDLSLWDERLVLQVGEGSGLPPLSENYDELLADPVPAEEQLAPLPLPGLWESLTIGSLILLLGTLGLGLTARAFWNRYQGQQPKIET